MFWRVEIKNQQGASDPIGDGIRKDIQDLGIKGIRHVDVDRIFNIEGDLDATGVEHVARQLLTDPSSRGKILT